MKQLFIILQISILGIAMVACDNNTPEWKEQYKEGTYLVVQFNPQAAKYRPNVMLTPDKNGAWRMRNLAEGGTCREFIYKKTPFIKVDSIQNWYMVDWKWNVALGYNHVVLPMLWTDVTKPDATYAYSDFEVVATGIIEKYGYVKRSEIDKIIHIQPAPAASTPGTWGYTTDGISTDHIAPVYLNRYYSTQDIPAVIEKRSDWEYTREDFLLERLRQDSLQDIYRERLATLIYSGMVNSVVHVVEK